MVSFSLENTREGEDPVERIFSGIPEREVKKKKGGGEGEGRCSRGDRG